MSEGKCMEVKVECIRVKVRAGKCVKVIESVYE